jgi:excisionase family DNA binding protein
MAVASRPSAARRRPEILFRARQEELSELAGLSELLVGSSVDDTAILIGHDKVRLTRTAHRVLRRLIDSLAKGQAITVAPHGLELTSQTAAELLGVSRPRLIKLLEGGHLRFRLEGTHRRIPLEDVLAFRQERARRFESGMRALQAITDEQTADDNMRSHR